MRARYVTGWTARLAALLAACSTAAGAAEPQLDGARIIQRALIEEVSAACAVSHPEMAARLNQELEQWLVRHDDELSKLDARLASLPPDQKASSDSIIASTRSDGRKEHEARIAIGQSAEACRGVVATYGDAESYPDANSFGEAVGMYRGHVIVARETASECIRRFPELDSEIQESLRGWRSQDALVVSRVEAHEKLLRDFDPARWALKEEEFAISIRTDIQNAFSSGPENVESHCRGYFSDLAAGFARQRAPAMYRFIETGPSAR